MDVIKNYNNNFLANAGFQTHDLRIHNQEPYS